MIAFVSCLCAYIPEYGERGAVRSTLLWKDDEDDANYRDK